MAIDRTTPPPVSRIESISLPQARRIILSNSMDAIIVHDPSLEIMRVALVCSGGTADVDNPAIPWIAGRLQSEGTSRLNGTEIAEMIDAKGAWMTNSVANHYSSTTFFALPAHINDILSVMSDIIFDPIFPEDDLARTISKGAANARIRQSTVRYQSTLLSNIATFGAGHPMSREASSEAIESVTRGDILSFRESFFVPGNMTLFVTGNITSELESALDHYFGQLSPAAPASKVTITPFHPEAPGIRTHNMPHARQSAVTMTIPTIPRSHPDYIPLRLTLMGLGGYFGSRLSHRIREELGLTYGISAALLGYEEGGVVQIATECNSDSVERLIEETGAEMRRLVSDPPAYGELSRICQAETASLLEVVETPFAVTEFYQVLHTTGLPETYFYDRLHATRTLTAGLISRLASDYLNPDNLIISVATP